MSDLIDRLRKLTGPHSTEHEAAKKIEDLERLNKTFQFALEYYSDLGTYNQHLLTIKTAESLRMRAVQTLAAKP